MAVVGVFALGRLVTVGVYAGDVRGIDPIVSTDWLSAHIGKVVILDIRSPADYATGDISGSIL